MTRCVTFLFCILFSVAVYAQSNLTQYSFSYSEPGYSAISGGNVYGNESTDEQIFVNPAVPLGGTENTGVGIPIGFDFTFQEDVYDRFAINANGWISLGQSALNPAVNISSTNGYILPLSSTIEILPELFVSRIAGFGRDIQAQAGSELRVQTIGVAPNRILVVQWTNYKKYGDNGSGDNFNFQIRLMETSNNISVGYGTMLNNTTAGTVQLGLRGAPATAATNSVCRMTTSDWSTTLLGANAASTLPISSSAFPVNGSLYEWNHPTTSMPPYPAYINEPADGSEGINLFQKLSWSSSGGIVNGYKLYIGTDNPPTNLVNAMDLGNTTSYQPSQLLTDETQYNWKIVPYNGTGDALDCPVWTFTTGSPVSEFPYTQGFENWISEGWRIDEGSCNFFQYTGANSNHWAAADFYVTSEESSYYLASPIFNAEYNLKLSFTWSHKYYPTYPNDALTIQISSDGETWEDIWHKTQASFDSGDGGDYTIPGTGVTEYVEIPVRYFNNNFQIRFFALSGFGSNLFIDNVCLDVTPVIPIGTGTVTDPYQIADINNLLWLSNNSSAWGSYFIQTADIDASDTEYVNGGAGFTPIGNSNNPFTGVYNGNGHIISGLYINRPTINFIGLFGKTNGAGIRNLGLIRVSISGSWNTGSLVGSNSHSSIGSCYSTGSVSGNGYTGGLVGNNYSQSLVSNSYSTGSVSGGNYTGGLVGLNLDTSTISYCYSTGTVSGTSSTGGLVGGSNVLSISNSFWDTNTSGQTTSAGGTGKTTAQMRDICTYLNAGWDFMNENANGTADIWGINYLDNGAYPFLGYQGYSSFLATGMPPIGSGSVSNPYQIDTLYNLLWFINNPAAWGSNFVQTADIDASDTEIWDSGAGFTPIGNNNNHFTGVYNGDGHSISGIYINRPSITYIGLFGITDGAIIQNLGILNVTISGADYTGGLVGYNYNNSTIRMCYSTGSVSGNGYTGGLVGGNKYESTISNSYCTGTVSGISYTGGLVGGNEDESTISYCYSMGTVSGTSSTGGLVGGNIGSSILNSFWDTNTSGQTTSAEGTGKTTVEMQDICTYFNAGWDFMDETANGTVDIWGINYLENGAYPFLGYQGYSNLLVTGMPPNGNGTVEIPYQIATLNNLLWLCKHSTAWGSNYVQTADIDASDTEMWDSGAGFTPIGNDINHFTGVYNGDGHTISGLYINRPSISCVGLFGHTNGASIQRLAITNADISGVDYIGGLVGYNYNNSIIRYCYITGSVSGISYTGGLAGYNCNNSTISNSYNMGSVSGNGGNYIGGLVGLNFDTSTISYCYSTGTVCGTSSTGGLVGGSNVLSISNSFWDTDTSGQTTSAGGTGKTTVEMQDICTYFNAGWDFMDETVNGTTEIWGINIAQNGGYPFLAWQGYSNIGVPLILPHGHGIEADPYQIATIYNLLWLSQNPDAWGSYYVQNADIDASVTEYLNGVAGFTPIGNSVNPFTGVYNGNGHIISGLYINRPTTNSIGLFGNTNGAGIRNLGLIRVSISGSWNTGSLVGYNYNNSTIRMCYSTGSVSGNNYAGGLVGVNYNSQIFNSYSAGSVSGNDYSGGLVGHNINNSTIRMCYSTGAVSGNTYTGGLVAVNSSSSISDSFWDIDTSGQTTSAGGTGKTTAQMQDISIYLSAGWDFMDETANGTAEIWGINIAQNGGYPFLAWQGYSNIGLTLSLPNGNGTEADPYQIATIYNLLWLSQNTDSWGSYFVQIADIDASDTEMWDGVAGFSPIGNNINPFTGDYNGDGYTISGIFINRPSTSFVGLFGYTYRAGIRNLGLTSEYISGDLMAGGLVGFNIESQIRNCYSTGTVSGADYAGGLVGHNFNNSTIRMCYSTGAVSGNTYTGGLVAVNSSSSISDSFWDIDTSGQTTSAGGTGKTTAQMQDVATFTSLSTQGLTTPWDFMGNPYNDTANADIWAIDSGFNGGYPNLSHHNEALSLSVPVPVISFNQLDDLVNISWEAVPFAASYKVYFSENPGAVFPADWTLLSPVSGDTLSVSDATPVASRFYRVIATTEAASTRYQPFTGKVKK